MQALLIDYLRTEQPTVVHVICMLPCSGRGAPEPPGFVGSVTAEKAFSLIFLIFVQYTHTYTFAHSFHACSSSSDSSSSSSSSEDKAKDYDSEEEDDGGA